MEYTADQYYYGAVGQALGHDVHAHEEIDVSSFNIEDITKSSFNINIMYSQPTSDSLSDYLEFGFDQSGILDDLPPADLLDSLLDEPACLDETIDLTQVDELYHLFNDDHKPHVNEIIPDLPSPISTLPSEPASPVNLERFINLDTYQPDSCQNESEDLTDMLQSLSDSYNIEIQNNEYADSSVSSPSCSYDSCSVQSPVSTSDTSSVYKPKLKKSSGKAKRSKAPKPKTPYAKLPPPKKERKKQQNKEAANRYRMKKKGETQTAAQQEAELLERSSQLKSDVDNLQREIQCMKELLSDVFNVHSF